MEIAVEMPTVLERLQNRMLASTRDFVEEWAELIPQITAWEDSHLLDNPPAEVLDEHRRVLDKCLMLGWPMARTAEQPDFPDRRLAEMVTTTMEVYRDKKAMWHGPRMPGEQSDRILAQCFPG